MKKILQIAVLVTTFSIPVYASADHSIAHTIQQIQAQIAALQNQIQSLQQQTTTPNTTNNFCYIFNANLKIGDRSTDVSNLHAALKAEGFSIPQDEQFRLYFGEGTASAVSGFQEKYKNEILTPNRLVRGSGYLGASTRAKLNQLYKCGNIIVVPPTITENQPSITVLSPNGGEAYVTGKNLTIKYVSQNLNGQPLTAYLYNSLNMIVRTMSNFTAANSNNVAYIMFDMERAGPDQAGQYKILLCAPEAKAGVCDYSDNFFTLTEAPTLITTPTITVTPTTLRDGDTMAISWGTSYSGNTSFYYEGTSGQMSTLIRTIAGTAGDFGWTVPAGISGTWRIRGGNNLDGNFYSVPFSILGSTVVTTPAPAPTITPTITVTPTTLRDGDTAKISWKTGYSGDTSFYYEGSSGQMTTLIRSVTGTAGDLNWTVPSGISGTWRIRGANNFDGNFYSAPFSILASTPVTAPAPIVSNATFTFSPNNGTLIAGKDAWTFTLSNAQPGDTLSVDAYKNSSYVGRLNICTVPTVNSPIPYTSCSSSAIPAAGDIGNWTEYVLINGARKGTVTFTVKAEPVVVIPVITTSSPTCSLSFSQLNIRSGDTVSWTVSSNPTGLSAYWHGTKNGNPDVSGSLAGITNFTQSYTYQTGDVGSYTRYLVLKDSYGNQVCTTNTVNPNVSITVTQVNTQSFASAIQAMMETLRNISKELDLLK